MIPQGRTNLNLEFDSANLMWRFTVARSDNGNTTSWQFGLTHPELSEFRDELANMIDHVEQLAGGIIR